MNLAPAHPHLSGRCVCLFSCDTLPDTNTTRRWRMLIRRDVLLSFLMRNCTVKAFLCNQLHNTPPETRRAARRGVYPLGRRRDSGLLSTQPCTRSLACRPPVRHTHTRTHAHTHCTPKKSFNAQIEKGSVSTRGRLTLSTVRPVGECQKDLLQPFNGTCQGRLSPPPCSTCCSSMLQATPHTTNSSHPLSQRVVSRNPAREQNGKGRLLASLP